MKALKIFLTLTLCMFLTTSFARSTSQPRLDSVDKQELTKELNQGLEDFKKESKGEIDFQKLKPRLAERLGDFYEMRVVTMEELTAFEIQYDQVALKYTNAKNEEKEKAIKNLFEIGFKTVEQTKLKKLKLNEVCNKWDCEDGLSCAMVPMRLLGKFPTAKGCSEAKVQCSSDSECCSGVCELKSQGKNIVGRCQATMRCFKPASMNQSCFDSPVCQDGDCLRINWNRSGINECSHDGNSCQSDTDCCSKSCVKNKCVPQFRCSNCVEQGQKAKRGRKCCDGLYKNGAGKCVREFPPLIIPGGASNDVKPSVKILREVLNVIFPTAQADDTVEFIKGNKTNAEGEGFGDYYDYGYGKAEFENQRKTETTIKNAVNNATGGGQKYASNCNPSDSKCIENAKNKYAEGLEQYMTTPEFPIGAASDFKTCKINFKNDYLHFLKKQNLLNLEFALAGFEFVMLGSGIKDFWKQGDSSSTYEKLQGIAKKHRDQRKEIFKKITTNESHLRCLCLDRIGYPKIPETTDQEWFKENCSEKYEAYQAQLTAIKKQYSDYDESMYQGDASGIKYKQMLVEWTGALADFQAELTAINTDTFTSSYDFSQLSNNLNWNDTDVKANNLYKFTVFPFVGGAPTNSSLGYSLGALLAAGAVAVVAAIGGPALISTWAAAGLIAAGAVTGGVAQWTVAALRGAWMTQPPVIEDKIIRSAYKCTKKGDMCQDYMRVLHQPRNKVCGDDLPFASNACVKHFIAVPRDPSDEELKIINAQQDDHSKTYYKTLYSYDLMVDPWVPWEVQRNVLIKDQKLHINYLKEAANSAISKLKGVGPDPYNWTVISKATYDNCSNASGRNDWYCGLGNATYVEKNGKYYKRTPKGQTGGHVNVSMSYLSTTFIDGTKAGYYAPQLKGKEKYIISDDAVEAIKNAARRYIVEEAQLLKENELAAQQKFADYAFKYHFVWPRVSRPGTIMYPPPGFLTYLDLVAHGFGTISYGNAEANYGYRERHKDYIADLLNTIQGLGTSSSLMTNDVDGVSVSTDSLKEDLTKKLNYLNNTSAGFKSAMQGNQVALTNGTTLNGQTLTSTDAAALNAVNRLNKVRDEQKAAAKQYQAETSGSDTAKKLQTAQQKMLSTFFTPAAGDSGYSNFAAYSNGMGAAKFDGSTKDGNSALQETNKYDFKRGKVPMLGKKKSYKFGQGSNETLDTIADKNSDNTIKGDDAEKVASAMDALDKNDKALQENSGDGLFDIVTKAYFRSYKRIFTPKQIDVEDNP